MQGPEKLQQQQVRRGWSWSQAASVLERPLSHRVWTNAPGSSSSCCSLNEEGDPRVSLRTALLEVAEGGNS